MVGIYSRLINTGTSPRIGSGAASIYCGLSADEITGGPPGNVSVPQFINNNLQVDNPFVNSLWLDSYFAIYQANSCIVGLAESKGLSDDAKAQLTGEVKFIRAYCYFYLVNLFGDVPLLTSLDWEANYLKARTSKEDIVEQIINDLIYAEEKLLEFYIIKTNTPSSERIRANKYAAKALLSRVYLYKGNWAEAEAKATSIINNIATYTIENDLNKVFQKTSKEAIWQLQPSNSVFPYTIPESNNIVPISTTGVPNYYLTSSLLNSIEPNDKRKQFWTKTSIAGTNTYYYPYKYSVRQGTVNGVINEYYTPLRLAEQFLIRAEARTKLNNLSGAISDLNIIRSRAGLSDLSTPLSIDQVFDAIVKEKRIEYFAELGHRWLDLKRWEKVNDILGPFKGSNWQNTDQLYPIPQTEINNDPLLIQNNGY
jgi:starch-binding outer membrane protein, SusD/RagB family